MNWRSGDNMVKHIIDSVFRALAPPLAERELDALETSLREEGCRDALVVWRGTIMDGHHRYQICTSFSPACARAIDTHAIDRKVIEVEQ